MLEPSSSFTAFAVTGAVAALGAAAGCGCSRVAQAYRRNIDGGAPADASTMAHSLRMAFRPERSTRMADPAALVMAAAFSVLFACYGPVAYFAVTALSAVLVLLSALIDAQTGLLPDALTQSLLWLGLASSWAGLGLPLHDALAGVMAGYGFLSCLLLVFRCLGVREAMGRGDLKLLAALGAWLGWQPLLWTLLLACLAGLAFAMWKQKSLRPRGAYPFGPFLAMGGAGVFLGAAAVQSWFW
jgi:leader peptidase (prepilin peptidase)/N-methyltransferase